MPRVRSKALKITLNLIALLGCCIWIQIGLNRLDWAHYQESAGLKKINYRKLVSNLDMQLTSGETTLGFRGQIAVLDFKKGRSFKKQYGVWHQEPDNFDKSFVLGSISKPLTAILLFQLIEQGQLKLSDNYCQQMGVVCSDAAKTISVQQLLNHTSGLPRSAIHPILGTVGTLVDFFVTEDPKPVNLSQLAHFSPATLTKTFSYSNLGFQYLSYLLEQKAGLPFWHIVRSNLSKRYGLPATRILDHSRSHRQQGLFSYYNIGLTNKLSVVIPSYFLPLPWRPSYGAGDIVASINDLSKLSNLIITRRLFTIDAMHEAFLPNRAPEYSNGWLRNKDAFGNPYYFHNGRYFSYSSLWYIFPKSQIAIIILSNIGVQRKELKRFIVSISDLIEGRSFQTPIETRTFLSLRL